MLRVFAFCSYDFRRFLSARIPRDQVCNVIAFVSTQRAIEVFVMPPRGIQRLCNLRWNSKRHPLKWSRKYRNALTTLWLSASMR